MKRRTAGSATATGWALRVAVVVLVAAVWFLPPFATGSQERDTAAIDRYDVAMELSGEGELRSTETIDVVMPPGKRGIFRIFDTVAPRRGDVEHPVVVESVERDGAPEPFTFVDSARGTETMRIGAESVFLDAGAHQYKIVSSTTDVLEPGDDGETLWWWDVVGSGWQMSMRQVEVRAQLPAEPLRAECVQGDDQPCTASIEGRTMTVRTGPLEPFTPVTVRVAFDADDVAEPIADDDTITLVASLIAAALGAIGAVALRRPTVEREPGFPVLFEPPFMVPPALGVRVLDETDAEADLQATLFDLAERGVLRLEGGDAAWVVEVVQPLSSELLHPLEESVLASLGLAGVGDRFVVDSTERSGRSVALARRMLRSQVTVAASSHLRGSGAGVALQLLGWLAAGLTVFQVGRYFLDRGWVWWPLLAATAAFALVAAPAMARPGVRTVRTAEGRDLWSRTGGFARFLTTESSESRFDAAAHLDWYPRYLAWAVALGVGEEWARRYQAQGVEVPEVPWILWHGHPVGPGFQIGSMTRSFDSAIASAASAYAAAEAARSASSGGGGFSGGSGGGGGGGGSW